MKRLVIVLCLFMVLCAVMGAMSFGSFAASSPEITVDNYTVTITEADSIKDIRFVLGEYSTTTEIRNAEGNVALSNEVVLNNTVNSCFVYEMPDGGIYSFWIRMQDGTNYIRTVDITNFTPKVTTYGVKITVDGLYDTKDVFIAEGEYQSYNEIKAAGYIVRLTPTKIAGKHSYTYTVTEPGMHTVLVRYNDGKEFIYHKELTVDEPVFVTNGLQVTVKNIPDIKVIRTAYGEYYTPGDTKRAPGARNFSNKAVIKDAEEYMLQYRDEGIITIVVEYNNGYIKVFHYDVAKKTPAVAQHGNTVTFSSLDGLVMIRYAEGEYSSSTEIKKAPGSAVLKPDAIENGAITVNLTEGTYTFSVQYDDDSYNYYVITVEAEEPKPCEHTWGEWIVTLEPAVGVTGSEVRICTLCGDTETRQIPALEPCVHLWSDWTVTLEPAIGVVGSEVRTCMLCGENESREVPALEEIDTTPSATNIRLSGAFSDNMVLQRDEKLSVWGYADPSSGTVAVEFGGETAYAAVAADGSWKAVFDTTFPYNTEGQPLKIKGGDGEFALNDVLIGDVYYLMGSTNVYYSLAELIIDLTFAGRINELNIDYDDRKDMRFFRVSSSDYDDQTGIYAPGTDYEYTDVSNGRTWMKPTDIAHQIIKHTSIMPPLPTAYDRMTISDETFSALGYMFGFYMTQKTDVPVGVIEIDASGRPITTFAPNEIAENWGHEILGADGTYNYHIGSFDFPELKSRSAYNQQIHPLSNFSTAGIIWYQGESDNFNTREMFGASYRNTYADQFTELMNYFRNTFGNDDFPVYFVELPAVYSNNGANAYTDFGGVRVEQGVIPQKLDDCYMISSSDLWFDQEWGQNLIPYIKHLNAYRVVDAVAADKFGLKDIEDTVGPNLISVEYEGSNKAYLTFDNVGSGLTTADRSGYVTGIEIFVISGGTASWTPHEGRIITGTNTILVDAGIHELLGVRYGRADKASHPIVRNLCNSNLMPAIAFVDFKIKEVFDFTIDNSGWDIHTPEKTTGYDYRYGPSIIDYGNGSMDIWFSATGSNASGELDYFTYKHSEDGGKTWTKEKIVLSPTGLSEDRLSVCDPGVIYFDGYYYIGYTSTLDKAGYSNNAYVARSKNPDGPYEKWNGEGWGGLPKPFITYQGSGQQWGMGEVSFVKVDGTLYIYYSLKCETGIYTYAATANATNPNWPEKITEHGRVIICANAQAAADVKYDRATGNFIAMAIANSNTADCYMRMYTSVDGIHFEESGRSTTNLKAYSMNNGLSAGPDGTFDSTKDKLYIAYAYGAGWGSWATRMAPITLVPTKDINLFKDTSAPDMESYIPSPREHYTIGITTDPHFFILNEGGSFDVRAYAFNDLMARTRINDTENLVFSNYDSSVVSFDGTHGTARGVGTTVVTLTYKDEFYVTFTVVVRAEGEDTTTDGIYSWRPWTEVYNIPLTGSNFSYMIRGILTTYNGIIGEAYNDHLDKAIFGPAEYPVTYSDYDPSILIIGPMGEIVPLSYGTTTVTVTVCGTHTFTVTVNITE